MTTEIKSDRQIQQDVLDELRWDPAVQETDVGVEVNDGVVTLSGTVDGYAKKLAAEQAVQRVVGVRALAEDIEIKVRSAGLGKDTEVALQIANMLDHNISVPRDRIKVRVENGRVILSGSVEWRFQSAVAEAVARQVHGVTKLTNDIEIKQPSVSAAEIRAGIDRAFERDARIDAGRVAVTVEGNHLTLSGTVKSWSEREEAENVGWRAAGVSRVTNKLVVRP